jgi:N-acetylglucosamine kinase
MAIDIGATKTEFACFDKEQRVRFSLVAPTPNNTWEDFTAFLLESLDGAENECGPIEDVGVSIAGMINPLGEVYCANLTFLSGRTLQSELGDVLGRPVIIANDAICFALAEARAGIAAGFKNVFALILGSGIGGALIINQAAVIGASGFTGEWGHGNRLDHTIDALGLTSRLCGCGGKNCLDLFGAGIGMTNIHFDYTGEQSDAQTILSSWHQADEQATKTIDTFVHLVSDALALVVNVVDPQVMPVGGGLSNDTRLIAYLDTETRRKSLGKLDSELIVPGQHNANGCLLGASLL